MDYIKQAQSLWQVVKDEDVVGRNTAQRVGDAGVQSMEAVKIIDHTLSVKVRSLASGSPRGTFPTVSKLRVAFPNGDNGIYIAIDTGHWHYWNGSSWKDGGVYQTTLDGGVRAEKGNKIYTDIL